MAICLGLVALTAAAPSILDTSPQPHVLLAGAQKPQKAPKPAHIFVSPDGSDTNDGLTPRSPFQTLERARQGILPPAPQA